MKSFSFSLFPYKVFNLIYKKNFDFYSFLYSSYKKLKDRDEIALLRKIVKPGMVVVDVGANIGFYSILLADLVGKKGTVHAFEPESINFEHLKRVCQKYRNVKVNRKAVGSRSGEIDLFISGDLNVDHLAYDDGSKRYRVRVKRISLDKYVDNKIQVDFVKIDTQGYEHQVLLGMKRVIQSSPRIVIMTEFSAFDLSRSGVRPEDYIQLIKNMGLRMYLLDGIKLMPAKESLLLKKNPNRAVYYNLLYVRKNQSINF